MSAESLRAPIGSLGLPDTLTELLEQAITVDWEEVVKQVGRVAANLAVENGALYTLLRRVGQAVLHLEDFNRELLAESGFIDLVLSPSLLDRNSSHPSDHALVASLYNLVVQGNSKRPVTLAVELKVRSLCLQFPAGKQPPLSVPPRCQSSSASSRVKGRVQHGPYYYAMVLVNTKCNHQQ